MINSRILLSAGVLLVTLVVAVVILVAGGSDGGTGDGPEKPVRAQLTLERAVQAETGQPELVISLPAQQLNTLRISGGETSVLLRCVDNRGAETIRQKHDWPLQEEVGFPPHVHQPARRQVLRSVRACRMTGRGIDFTARVRRRVPPAQ